jgi:hypothetical protein
MYKLLPLLLIALLTIITGIADSQGFIHSSFVWKKGRFIWEEAGKAIFAFGIGILFYWLSIKYMQQVGIKSAEIQTTIWFAATIIGVALVSGKLVHWNLFDQILSGLILFGIGFLIFRTGG